MKSGNVGSIEVKGAICIKSPRSRTFLVSTYRSMRKCLSNTSEVCAAQVSEVRSFLVVGQARTDSVGPLRADKDGSM